MFLLFANISTQIILRYSTEFLLPFSYFLSSSATRRLLRIKLQNANQCQRVPNDENHRILYQVKSVEPNSLVSAHFKPNYSSARLLCTLNYNGDVVHDKKPMDKDPICHGNQMNGKIWNGDGLRSINTLSLSLSVILQFALLIRERNSFGFCIKWEGFDCMQKLMTTIEYISKL